MAEIRDVFAKRVDLEIKGEGESWRVVYDPSRWPVRWHVRSGSGEDVTYAEVIAVLAACVTEWDLTLDGEEIPVDEESLWNFPRGMVEDLQRRILWHEMGFDPDAVLEGKSEPEPKKKSTRRGSPRRKRQTTSK